MVIVGLVVLVPLVACVHSVEVLGPPRAVLLMPPVRLQITATRFSSNQCCALLMYTTSFQHTPPATDKPGDQLPPQALQDQAG